MALKILVIDTLRDSDQYRYRLDFWRAHEKSFGNIEIDIPRERNGDIVVTGADGSIEKIDVGPYDLLIIHETDDQNTGYESVALKAGKRVVLYSDGFLDDAKFEQGGHLLKIKGELLYTRLLEFLREADRTASVDLQILWDIDPLLEELLKPFVIADPFKKDPKLAAAIPELVKRADEIVASRNK